MKIPRASPWYKRKKVFKCPCGASYQHLLHLKIHRQGIEYCSIWKLKNCPLRSKLNDERKYRMEEEYQPESIGFLGYNEVEVKKSQFVDIIYSQYDIKLKFNYYCEFKAFYEVDPFFNIYINFNTSSLNPQFDHQKGIFEENC